MARRRLAAARWNFVIDQYINPWLPPPPWRHLPAPVTHFFGHRPAGRPPRHDRHPVGNLVVIFWAFIGVFCAISLIEVVGQAVPAYRARGGPLIVGSFGAAAVLEFYAIESPLSQPRNAVLGQLVASVTGVAVSKLVGLGPAPVPARLIWTAGSLACACATALMALTGTAHPPAGATALLAVVDERVAGLGWFLVPTMLLGCVLMQAVALVVNNVARRFPLYWWTPEEVGTAWRRGAAAAAGRPDSGTTAGQGEETTDADADTAAAAERKQEEVDDDAVADERTLEEGRPIDRGAGQMRIVIRPGGRVEVPEDMGLLPEELMFLEGLSARL